MTVFAVINAADPLNLGLALNVNFPGNVLQVSANEWLVAASGITAKDVADKVGITDGSKGAAIVLTTAGYYGRAPNNVWEWLVAKIQQP
jgi:hypothetical protein